MIFLREALEGLPVFSDGSEAFDLDDRGRAVAWDEVVDF